MIGTSEKPLPYFGISLKNGTNPHEFQAQVEVDIRMLGEGGIDESVIVYLIQNFQTFGLAVDEVDLKCARPYIMRQASLEDIAGLQKLSQEEVLVRIDKVIIEIVTFLRTLQYQFSQ